MEEEHDGACIVLASHADTLQIAQTYIAGADARTFSQYRFANGEVKRNYMKPQLPTPADVWEGPQRPQRRDQPHRGDVCSPCGL